MFPLLFMLFLWLFLFIYFSPLPLLSFSPSLVRLLPKQSVVIHFHHPRLISTPRYFASVIPKCRSSNEDDDDCCTYTLTFNIEFPHDNDTVYFAHSYPYTYSDLQVIWVNWNSCVNWFGWMLPPILVFCCWHLFDQIVNQITRCHTIYQPFFPGHHKLSPDFLCISHNIFSWYSIKIGLFDGNTKASN